MFYLLSKLVAFLLEPLIWVFIAFILALRLKNRRMKKSCFIAAIAMVLFFGNGFFYAVAERQWSKKYISSPDTTLTYDYALVQGGFGIYNQVTGRSQIKEAGDRLTEAIRLYHTGRVKALFITGDGTFSDKRYPESRPRFLKYLSDLGVNTKDVILDDQAQNTRESAARTAQFIGQGYTARQSMLITCAVHMPRALACYHKAGLFPTPYSTSAPVPFELRIYNFGLGASNFEHWSLLIHELFGMVTYRLMGYI